MNSKEEKDKQTRHVFWLEIVLIVVGFVALGFLVLSATGARKPAIYLYPESEGEISVDLDLNGWLTSSNPRYKQGWDVFVEKDGLIEGKYDYLAYEANLWKLNLPKRGWVVEYKNLESWMDARLPELCLNSKEIRQFKEYWLDKLPRAKYYQIKLLSDQYLNRNMGLNIEPSPDTKVRRIFHFKPLQKRKDLKEPLVDKVQRKGFVVVEWGGILAN